MRLISFLFFLFTASVSYAACSGTDLRETLSDEEKQRVAQEISAIPYPEGNHWLAQRGAEKIYLIGTFHIYDSRFEPLTAGLREEIAGASVLFLELTEQGEKELQQEVLMRPELMFIVDGPTLPDQMEEKDWQALAQAAGDRGIPSFMAAKMKPWYLALMLSLPPCVMETLQSTPRGLDRMLGDVAEAEGVEMRSLEPIDTVFSIFARQDEAEQIAFLKGGLLERSEADDLFATILLSYLDERPAEVWALSKVLTQRFQGVSDAEINRLFEQMETLLLKERNMLWLPEILKASQEGSIVVAAGAAHLGGRYGLLELLSDEGFSLTRLEFPL